jgi:hypothetical protein
MDLDLTIIRQWRIFPTVGNTLAQARGAKIRRVPFEIIENSA